MHQRYLLAMVLGLILGSLLSCSGNGSAPAPDNVTPSASDGNAPSRSASATFTYFFYDGVSNTSAPLWNVTNGGGSKYWLLSNTCYSAPKAWVIGQNYWNSEYDTLTTDPFTVPANTNGIRLAFYSRFNISAGDYGYVLYSINGTAYQILDTFTNASNPAYPGWTKYSYGMPNTGGSPETWRIRYVFTSNGSGVNWGYGVDTVSVYQTNLNPPINVSATDNLSNQIIVTWNHNNAGNLAPDSYHVWRSFTGLDGSYSDVGTIDYPGTAYVDMTGTAVTLWYKVKARKTGWPDSVFSNGDTGTAI